MRERNILVLTVGFLGLVGLGAAVGLLVRPLPVVATDRAVVVDQMLRVFFGGAAVVFAAMGALVTFAAVRGRLFGAVEGRVARGLEALWVVVPALIVIAIVVYSIETLQQIESPSGEALTVEVSGSQFVWAFHYPGSGDTASELHLPLGRPAELHFTSADVIHSFWVPEFGGKVDALPGRTTVLRITPRLAGEYTGVCAELCGEGHSTMVAKVIVEDSESFERWLDEN